MQLVAMQGQNIIELRLEGSERAVLRGFNALRKLFELCERFAGASESCFDAFGFGARSIAQSGEVEIPLGGCNACRIAETRFQPIYFQLKLRENGIGVRVQGIRSLSLRGYNGVIDRDLHAALSGFQLTRHVVLP